MFYNFKNFNFEFNYSDYLKASEKLGIFMFTAAAENYHWRSVKNGWTHKRFEPTIP